MKVIRSIIDFLWPLLPPMDTPIDYPKASTNDIGATGNSLAAVCSMAEKSYLSENERMRTIESKASMFIGTTTFMATFIVGVSTYLAKVDDHIGGFYAVMVLLAFLISLYMSRVLYLSIRALERSVVVVVDPLQFYKEANMDEYYKKLICYYINATTHNHKPINEKMNYVVAAQRYYKRVLTTLGLYAMTLFVFCIKKYDLVGGSPFGKVLEMIDGYHPEPWLLLLLMGISSFAIILVVVNCVCVKAKRNKYC